MLYSLAELASGELQMGVCLESQFDRNIKTVPKLVCVATALIAVAALLVWLFFPSMKAYSAESMKFNTALSILSLSFSLWFLQDDPQDTSKLRLNTGYFFAFIALSVGVLTLAQYIFGYNFGIDELFVADFANAESRLYPGRMSPIANVCFVFMGAGLLLINVGNHSKVHISSLFIVPVFFISILVIIGYVYSERSLYQVGSFIRISWQTALCCQLLTIGTLFSRPKDGPIHILTSQGLGGVTVRRLFPLVVLVPIVLGAAWLYYARIDAGDRELGVSLFVISTILIFLSVIGFVGKMLDSLEREREKLSENERVLNERFLEVLQHAPLVVWATDQYGNYTLSQGRALNYVNLQQSELVGKNHFEVYKDNPAAVATVRKALSGETFTEVVSVGERTYTSNYVPSKNSRGEVIGISVVSSDISEVIALEKKFTEILDLMGDGFISLDKNFKITQINPRHEKITRIEKQNQLGKNIFDIFPDAKNQESNYWSGLNRAMSERVSVDFEDFYPSLDLWTQVNVYPVSDGGLAVLYRDTTIKHIAQQAVEIERQKFEAIFVDSPAAMALLRGPTLIFEKVNTNYRNLMAGRELLNKPLLEALPELEGQPFHELLSNVLETGKPYVGRDIKAKLIRRSGVGAEDCYFDFAYTRIVDGQRKPYGVYIHAMEVTEKVLARKKLEKISDDLKTAVQARDDFMSIASHELKTPLTSLKLQSQIFKRSVLKGDLSVYNKERIDIIVDQTDKQSSRLTRLVDDMLDISRIRSGQLTIDREEFNFCGLVRETLERLSSQFSPSPQVSGESVVPILSNQSEIVGFWDKLRIEQVITNLLTNALRYGGGKPIDVRLEDRKENVLLAVNDNGIGIAESAQEKIFDRFERAINANEVSGLGLGLFITKKIVLAHGGKIWVHSELGKGSTFFVELPKYAPKVVFEPSDAL
jgi:PAS domain S-box-containing protein